MRAGCSISDSTPPSDSASVNSRVRRTTASAASSPPPQARTTPCRRSRASAGRRRRGRGGRAGPGTAPGAPPGGARSSVDDRRGVGAVPVHAHRQRLEAAQHQPAVERAGHRPDGVLQEAEPLGQLVVVGHARAPPTTSEWPPRYLVVECTTTSAPSASGCCRYGVANVLSTTQRRAARRAPARPAAAMSTIEQQRVGRRLDPDQRGVVGARPRSTASRSVEVDRGRSAAPRRVHLVRTAGRCRRRRRRRARRGRRGAACAARRPRPPCRWRRRSPCAAALQRGQARLERGAGRVAGAGVLVALVLADAVLGEGRRLVDRHDRPRRSAGRASWPAWMARVSKPGCPGRRPVTASGPRRSEEAEQVGAGEDADRVGRRRHTRTAPADLASTATASTGSPRPTIGSGGPITSATGRSRTAGRGRPGPCSPRSSHAADHLGRLTSGLAACTTGIWLTRRTRARIAIAVAHRLVGVDVHERRAASPPCAPSTSPSRAAPAGARKP